MLLRARRQHTEASLWMSHHRQNGLAEGGWHAKRRDVAPVLFAFESEGEFGAERHLFKLVLTDFHDRHFGR